VPAILPADGSLATGHRVQSVKTATILHGSREA
jgi:hypothetical protein